MKSPGPDVDVFTCSVDRRAGGKCRNAGPHRPCLGDYKGSRPILSYSDSDATRTAVTDFCGIRGSPGGFLASDCGLIKRLLFGLSPCSLTARIPATCSKGGPHGRRSDSSGCTFSRSTNDSSVIRGGADYQYVHCAVEDLYRPASQRRLVGAVPAHGDRFYGLRIYSRTEDRFPQDHGKPDAGATEGAGPHGIPAC